MYTIFSGIFEIQKGDKVTQDLETFNIKAAPIFMSTKLKDYFKKHILQPVFADLREFALNDSGWTLRKIYYLTIVVSKYNDLRVGLYIPLQAEIYDKNAIVNIKNNDDKRFQCSVVFTLVARKS